MSERDLLLERYAALWAESDETVRRTLVDQLWVEGGTHFTPKREFHGADAITARIGEAYRQFLAAGENVFELRAVPDGHHDAVRVRWHVRSIATGKVVGTGDDILLLEAAGRISSDYQFVG
jgi:hypothetical protein